jgi:subtilisin-like proprotein convertase family protein
MSSRRARIVLTVGFIATVVGVGAARAAEVETVGRVKVVPVGQSSGERWASVADALASRFAPSGDKKFPDQRVISLRPRTDDPDRFDATIYDYRTERSYDVVVDTSGNELSRRPSSEQPARTLQELADAYAVVGANPAFSKALAKGELQLYEAMPPVTVDANGRRLVNVGIMSTPVAGKALAKNEIVSVDVPTGRVVRYPSGAPETSRAGLLACGPGSSTCGAATGSCTSSYQVSWPASDPVWKFTITHPSCTQSVQSQGTGLAITDVYYRGRLILKRGEVPVLNVLYSGNTCGPYRDWLYSEDCFNATGTDVGSGIRVTSAPPSTLCESQNDGGNFKGDAIYDQGDTLWLMTETNAGWYRYVMEWRFHLDGTIEPIFGFGATSNNCTCNLHFHHAYWRLEWAVDAVSDGTTDDPATGINTLERHRAGGASDEFDPVPTEGSFVRPPAEATKDTWRVTNPQTGDGYMIQPGDFDGSASGDTYGKWDVTALALNSGQIDDPNSDTSINVAPWVNGESLGTSKRLVTWYHATYTHDDPGGGGEPCELVGPKLVPTVPCAGTISLDKSAYNCGSTISVTLNDSDLAGTGSAAVSVSSGAEPTPEPLALAESPAGSGHFVGSIPATAAVAAPGDGKISVVDGDVIHARYLDASACGTPNVTVEKTASVDCVPPALQNVSWTVSGTVATISWQTSEATTGVVHFGTTIPTASSAAGTGSSTAHAVSPSGLAECTVYYFWLESADAAGNVVASNSGGGYYAFRTGHNAVTSFTSTDTPVAIPDNNTTGATSSIAVPDAQPIQDVNVTANITHTWDGDLALSLISPGGTSIALSNHHGTSGDNYTATVFDDEAVTPISSGAPPFTGSFKPETPLSAVDGTSSAGTWRFKVVDNAGQDVGTIDSWTLALTLPPTTCAAPAPPPPVSEGAIAPALLASRSDAAGSSVHLDWGVAGCPATNYHLVYGALASLPAYTVAGGVCGIGPLGTFTWAGVPAGDLWFVAVADDAGSTEGSWGASAPAVDRNGTVASGTCGFSTRTNAGACP